MAELVSLIGERGADPYLLIGVLLEGAVRTLAKHIPLERQGQTTSSLGSYWWNVSMRTGWRRGIEPPARLFVILVE